MNRIAPALLLITTCAFAEDGWKAISTKGAQAARCKSPAAMSELFQLSASGTFIGAAHQEYLSEMNEKAFLSCPSSFLKVLQIQPRNVQTPVLANFGITHEPSKLGLVLQKYENDPTVGAFVQANFTNFLKSAK